MEHCENEVYNEYRCQWFHYSIAITFFNQKLGLIIIHKSKQSEFIVHHCPPYCAILHLSTLCWSFSSIRLVQNDATKHVLHT